MDQNVSSFFGEIVMRISEALEFVASVDVTPFLASLEKNLDPEWIESALQATGTATLRRRRLPAEQVIWLVIGMALFRGQPIDDVARTLDLVFPSSTKRVAARSSIIQARKRLGDQPLQWLFSRSADAWTHQSARRNCWRDLSLYAVDGTTLRVPDTDENRAHYGVATGGKGKESGYPLVRLCVLMGLRSHLIGGASFGAYENGEYTLAADLWEMVPDKSLTIVDRNFLSANLLLGLQRGGNERNWLVPAKKTSKWTVVKTLGRGDHLVEMTVSSAARKRSPDLPKKWIVRAIQYRPKGRTARVVLTSLIDDEKYPKNEIAKLYHERWEIELGFNEIKTKMLRATTQPLRSKSPRGVDQEIWGVLIAYNLIRLEMERVSDNAGVEPTQISFVMVFRLICDEFTWASNASPGAIPKNLKNLSESVSLFILPKRRTGRTYERAVKIKMSNYPRKRRSRRQVA